VAKTASTRELLMRILLLSGSLFGQPQFTMIESVRENDIHGKNSSKIRYHNFMQILAIPLIFQVFSFYP
jgi:hypothetical protein